MKNRMEVDEDELDSDLDNPDENKSKREIRVLKHARLLDYLEEKRLRKELDIIDGW